MRLNKSSAVYGVDRHDYENMSETERMRASDAAQSREIRNEKRRAAYAAAKAK